MEEYRKTGIIVGTLFILGTLFGMLSTILVGTLGALFILFMGISLAFIPIVLYPILKKKNETLAMGYVVFRGAIETVMYIATFISTLLLLQINNMGNLLISLQDLTTTCIVFVFSIGAIILYYALYKYKLIPRLLSIFGLIAITLHLVTGFLMVFGLQTGYSSVNIIMNLPIFLQEMIMAIWLIIKGFNSESRNITKINEKSMKK